MADREYGASNYEEIPGVLEEKVPKSAVSLLKQYVNSQIADLDAKLNQALEVVSDLSRIMYTWNQRAPTKPPKKRDLNRLDEHAHVAWCRDGIDKVADTYHLLDNELSEFKEVVVWAKLMKLERKQQRLYRGLCHLDCGNRKWVCGYHDDDETDSDWGTASRGEVDEYVSETDGSEYSSNETSDEELEMVEGEPADGSKDKIMCI
ncbi:hypothetical protein BDZ91DRAFT_832420 [Kalaharituber pfeilii]|nr:hypothetical protein BDZ91DRAFT_832420 [Kalaharituber pfeilii]